MRMRLWAVMVLGLVAVNGAPHATTAFHVTAAHAGQSSLVQGQLAFRSALFDFALSADPASIDLPGGQTAVVQIATRTLVGAPGLLSLSFAQVPSGITARLDRRTLVSGETAALTVSAGSVSADRDLILEARSGHVAHRLSIHVRVIPHPPVLAAVQLDAPEDGERVQGTILLKAHASLPARTTLRLVVDGTPVVNTTTESASATLDTTAIENGPHAIMAEVLAPDQATVWARSAIQVQVNNGVARPGAPSAATAPPGTSGCEAAGAAPPFTSTLWVFGALLLAQPRPGSDARAAVRAAAAACGDAERRPR